LAAGARLPGRRPRRNFAVSVVLAADSILREVRLGTRPATFIAFCAISGLGLLFFVVYAGLAFMAR
jgi:hypothetical protein